MGFSKVEVAERRNTDKVGKIIGSGCVLLSSLIVLSCGEREPPQPSPDFAALSYSQDSRSPQRGDFAGSWVNEEDSTRHIAQVEIQGGSESGPDLRVRIWGSCKRAEDCFWGDEPLAAKASSDSLPEASGLWKLGNSTRSQTFRLSSKDRLQVETHARLNGPPSFEYRITEFFKRGSRRDKGESADSHEAKEVGT